MDKLFGGHSMVAPLRRVLVRRPDAAFAVEAPELWHYTSRPDLAAAQQEHDQLTGILRRAARRGRTLPRPLLLALTAVAERSRWDSP